MCNNVKCKYCNSNRINQDGIINSKQKYLYREIQNKQ